EGWTALHLACQSAPAPMVELLLQRGARPGAKGKSGRSAADCASRRPDILALLHVATGGKVPLPLGLPSVAAAAAAANGLLASAVAAANGGGSRRGASSAAAARGSSSSAAAAANGSSASAAAANGGGGSGAPPSTSRSPSSSQRGLLPGTAAVLEPLESVEATLAALLADMGGALCSLQAGAVFGGGGGCCVDPVGHCIRPLDKRLVMVCTLGCQFSFHLQCWKSAREGLKERWPGFSGSLAGAGRYGCIAPGCPGYIREQAICDGSHMTQQQSAAGSRLYGMPQEVYDSLPPSARPMGGGAPPLGGGDGGGGGGGMLLSGMGGLLGGGMGGVLGGMMGGMLGGGGGGTSQQPVNPSQSGGGAPGMPSLAALGPSLTLAQAMVQAAQAVGSMVGGPGRMASSQLAALLAGSAPPPVSDMHS
ncbi:hypothetical protein TSOC_012368, partial [Tetrabaena socialis]